MESGSRDSKCATIVDAITLRAKPAVADLLPEMR